MKNLNSIRKRKQKQWLTSVLGISMVLGYKVMSHFNVCTCFLLRALQHISLEWGKKRFQSSVLPMVWQLATRTCLQTKISKPNRKKHKYAKMKWKHLKIHENYHWVPTGVYTVPHFGCGIVALHLHLNSTVCYGLSPNPISSHFHGPGLCPVCRSVLVSQWQPLGSDQGLKIHVSVVLWLETPGCTCVSLVHMCNCKC